MRSNAFVLALLGLGGLGAVASGVVEWRRHGPYGDGVSSLARSVDAPTGQVNTPTGPADSPAREAVLAFSARGYGKPDTWSFLINGQQVRMEFDEDLNGIVDRWEYYGFNGTLERAYE